MDFSLDKAKVYYYPFFSSWKNPIIYIVLCVAIGLYAYIFCIHHANDVWGRIEKSKEIRVYLVWFVTTVLFHIFRSSELIQKVDSLFFRGLLLIGAMCLSIIFVLLAWSFNTYDNQVMNTYTRILPFNNSPYLRTKDTLMFNNIKSIKYNSGIDTGGALVFILNNGPTQELALGNISSKSRDILLVTLYDECEWLQEDIEKEFGSIERRRIYVEGKKDYGDIKIVHVLIHTLFLWMILAQIVCLIVYTFNINFRA